MCLPIVYTSNRKYQHEENGEKVGENRDKIYLSPKSCLTTVFVSLTHANLSLSCDYEGYFREW